MPHMMTEVAMGSPEVAKGNTEGIKLATTEVASSNTAVVELHTEGNKLARDAIQGSARRG